MQPTREKVISIFKGSLIAAAGAGAYYGIAEFGALDYGPWTPTIVAILAILTNAARKFLGPSPPVNRDTGLPKHTIGLLLFAGLFCTGTAEAQTRQTCIFGSRKDYSPQLQQIADSAARISEQLAELRGYMLGTQGRLGGQGGPYFIGKAPPYGIPAPQLPYNVPPPTVPEYSVPAPGPPEYSIPPPGPGLPVPSPGKPEYNVPPPGVDPGIVQPEEPGKDELSPPPASPPITPAEGTTGSSFRPAWSGLTNYRHTRIENPQWRPIR